MAFALYPPRTPFVNPPDDTLAAALERHGIALPEAQAEQLDRYCQLLWEWNEKINLTRHAGYEKFVARDLVDSLAFSRFLQDGEAVLDVGSGGGVPGIPLAILRPDLRIALSESVGKRARVLTAVVEQLGLAVPVFHARAESVLSQQRFDTLTARAVARMKKLLEWLRPHWDAFDRLLLLKGPSWLAERGEARHYGLLRGLALRKLASYPLPGTHGDSVLLQISRPDHPSIAAR